MIILAIDDEENALALLCEAIKDNLSQSVNAFTQVEAALRFAKNNKVDIAFLDIEMGTANGLSVAKALKKLNPEINLVFVTGYAQYMGEAFALYASDYILKPATREKVCRALGNLRKPIASNMKISVHTFGNFDISVNDKPVNFKRSKAKECLAYLVDRHGAGVSKKEIAAVIFEDSEYNHQTQDIMSKLLVELERGLKQVGAQEMLVKTHNYYAVDTTKFICDRYEYEKGNPRAINSFNNEYMTQYSWAELSLGAFYK